VDWILGLGYRHAMIEANNVQGLDGDAGGDGRGLLTHTLKRPGGVGGR
jgi:hypothetical protein